jgi:multidrug resistance efflux pump
MRRWLWLNGSWCETELTAPVSGTVTSLTLHVGDTAQADVPLIGIVDARAWRIVANYKEGYIRSFAVGDIRRHRAQKHDGQGAGSMVGTSRH